ncbi:MAG: methylmalonyl-CoA epimerase [Planctomycetes bacterium RBG_16_59_8]|nr:MAG: methylmalonyl-CoA epimerase [Planctomycetes bacterium RBG_16_59_8]
MEIKKIDHIGIAVTDAEKAEETYCGMLGLSKVHAEILKEMKLKVVTVAVGESRLELLEPLAGEATISRFLQAKGEGIHHICLEVADVHAATKELKEKGFRPVWDEPRTGAGGRLVNFLHPSQTHGVLIEFSQPSPNISG